MTPDPAHFEFRGFSYVWGPDYQMHTTWFGSGCIIAPDFITVCVFSRKHIHRKEDVVELRWNDGPIPGFVVISRLCSKHIWSSFGGTKSTRIRSALEASGYTFTRDSRWPSWQEVLHDTENDTRTYGLMELTG